MKHIHHIGDEANWCDTEAGRKRKCRSFYLVTWYAYELPTDSI